MNFRGFISIKTTSHVIKVDFITNVSYKKTHFKFTIHPHVHVHAPYVHVHKSRFYHLTHKTQILNF
jgi:hypothetical protein